MALFWCPVWLTASRWGFRVVEGTEGGVTGYVCFRIVLFVLCASGQVMLSYPSYYAFFKEQGGEWGKGENV